MKNPEAIHATILWIARIGVGVAFVLLLIANWNNRLTDHPEIPILLGLLGLLSKP